MSTVADYQQAELSRDKVEALLEGEGLDFEEVIKKHLWDGRTFMRRNASMALRLSGDVDGQFVNLLTVAAKDSDGIVRENAVAAMAKVEMPVGMALPPLLGALTDAEETVRLTARNALDRLADRADDEELTEALVGHLNHPSGPARAAVSDLLMKFPQVAVGYLITALAQSSRDVSQGAYRNLVRMGDKAAPGLIEALGDPGTRTAAAALLVQLPALGEDELEALAEHKGSDDQALVELAEAVEKELKGGTKAAPPAPIEIEGFFEDRLEGEALEAAAAEDVGLGSLLRALQDGRAAARANAAALLGAKAKGEDDAHERSRIAFPLAALVRDGAPMVRSAAVAALRSLGEASSVGPLLVALSDSEAEVAEAAREGVMGLGGTHPGALLGALSAEQPGVCHITVMDALVAAGADVVGELTSCLSLSPNLLSREIAAASLERVGPPAKAATDALVAALGDPATSVQRAAASALGFVASDDEAVLDALKQAARRSELSVRMAASTARARLTGTWEPPQDASEPEPIEIEGFEASFLTAEDLKESAGTVEVERLVQALGDGRVEMRHNAAVALGVLGDEAEDAASALAVALKDGTAGVRAAAATALGQLGDGAVGRSVRPLVGALSDSVPEVAVAAREALGALGDAAAKPIAATLQDKRPPLERVAPVLVDLGDAGVAAAIEALADEDVTPRGRANAARVLRAVGTDAKKKGVKPLTKGLADESAEVRAACATALGAMADDSKAVLEALGEARKDVDTTVRRAAVGAIDRLTGALDKPAPLEPIDVGGFSDSLLREKDAAKALKGAGAERLIVALSDGRAEVRHNAALALAKADAADVAMPLYVVSKDGDPRVRAAVCAALGALGDDAAEFAVAALVQRLADPVPEVADAAREAVGKLGVDSLPYFIRELNRDPSAAAQSVVPIVVALGADIIEPLKEVVENDELSSHIRANALLALGRLGPDHADKTKPVISRARTDPDTLLRAAGKLAQDAADGLEPAPATLEALEIPDEFEDLTLSVTQAKEVGKDVDVEILRQALHDGRIAVRRASAIALSAHGKKADPAIDNLLLALKDTDPHVVIAVAQTLGELKLGPELAGPALCRALRFANEESEPVVLDALSSYGKKIVDPILQGLNDRPENGLPEIIRAARHLPKEFTKPLTGYLGDEHNPLIRENAADALAAVGRDAGDAEKALLDSLDEMDNLFRMKCILAIGRCVKSTKAQERLVLIQDEDERPEIQIAIEEALMYMGQP